MYTKEKYPHEYFKSFTHLLAHDAYEEQEEFKLLLRQAHLVNTYSHLIVFVDQHGVPVYSFCETNTSLLEYIARMTETHGEHAAANILRIYELDLHSGWTTEDIAELHSLPVGDFKGAVAITSKMLLRNPDPFICVCGPISTGSPDETIHDRLWKFHRSIQKLTREGKNVFDQMPVEPTFEKWHEEHKFTTMDFVRNYYEPLFGLRRPESNRRVFIGATFLHGWRQSTGAKLEYDYWNNQDSRILNVLPSHYLDTEPGYALIRTVDIPALQS